MLTQLRGRGVVLPAQVFDSQVSRGRHLLPLGLSCTGEPGWVGENPHLLALEGPMMAIRHLLWLSVGHNRESPAQHGKGPILLGNLGRVAQTWARRSRLLCSALELCGSFR